MSALILELGAAHVMVPLRTLSRTDAAFRFACGDIKPLSRRVDKPHIWFYGGYWRISLWNGRHADLKLWDQAHAHVKVANVMPPDQRATYFHKAKVTP